MPESQAAEVTRPRRTKAGRAGAKPLALVEAITPAFGSRLVRRHSLVGGLFDAHDASLALIVAPPGYGKSSLLAEWADTDERAFLWLAAGEDCGELTSVVREARQDHPSFVVVVDNGEQFKPRALADAMGAALTALPAGSTIALASRSMPRLAVGRLRAHRMLTELHTEDLAMNAAEAMALLQTEGVSLSLRSAKELVDRTEGWPAALYLAALSSRTAPGRSEPFSGQHHLMFDYLNDEVLAALPAELRSFALQSSVLDRMAGPTCDVVLERSDSARVLAELAQRCSLLLPIDSAHETYRWHRLVRDALGRELRRSEPAMLAALQRRASLWYSHRGQTRRAIDHAASVPDPELTGEILCANPFSYLGPEGGKLIEGWLETLGNHQIANNAPLALAASLNCFMSGKVQDAERWSLAGVAAVKRGGATSSKRLVADRLAVVRALTQGDVRATGELAAAGARSEPEDSQWRPLFLLLEGVCLYLRGDRETAERILEEAARLSASLAPGMASLCLAPRTMIAIERKDWDLAAELADQAEIALEEWELADHPLSSIVFAAAAASRAHDGRIDEAKADLRRGIELLATLGDFVSWYGAAARVLLAHASLWLADVVAARTLLAEASRLARRAPAAVVFGDWFDRAWAYIDTLAEDRLAGPSSLTIAELRILRFLPSHRSFREIAAQLDVSANTVKTQAHSVYRKLGVASRSEAVSCAVDCGLLGQ